MATNTILEGKGASTGLITTEGFKYVLEIGRHDIPSTRQSLRLGEAAAPGCRRGASWRCEKEYSRRDRRYTLDEAGCREMARRLRAMGVEAVAIVFLYSFANAAHEQRAAAIVQEEAPQVQVSLSSDVLPVFREYERAMATVLNAYVQPVVSRYIGKLESGLRTRGYRGHCSLWHRTAGSSGHRPRRSGLCIWPSGPTAGAIGASYVGRLAYILTSSRLTWVARVPTSASFRKAAQR